VAAGDSALAGDPDAVRDAGAWLKGRSIGGSVHLRLSAASGDLGAQSGAPVSVARLLTLIRASSGPAALVQHIDQDRASSVLTYGSALSDLHSQARRLRGDITAAADDSAATTHRLHALDEERMSRDSIAAQALDGSRAEYTRARNALPDPPRVPARVSITVSSPDGATRTYTALQLAQLTDPARIRETWDRLTPEQRRQLLEDSPELLGNLDGIPLRERNTANALTATAYRDELAQDMATFILLESESGQDPILSDEVTRLQGEIRSLDAILGDRNGRYGKGFGTYKTYDEDGNASTQNGVTIVGFSPLRDGYVTYQGPLDQVTGDIPSWVEQVGVLVPGTNAALSSFDTDVGRARALFNGSGKRSGYFTWHGAPMPRFDPPAHIADAAERGFADVAGARLAGFTNSLVRGSSTDVVLVGHSYGAAVVGEAERLGLRADRVVYVAPAGLGHGVTGLGDFPHTKDAPHFVLQARNDAVVGWNQGLEGFGIGHGGVNPLTAPGVTRLETGYLDEEDPERGTIESVGGIDAHSAVFDRGSTAYHNIVGVVTGAPVTIYHPDDAVSLLGLQFSISDTGAPKSSEFIPSTEPRG
jgi:hypothetical protein